MVLSYQVCLFCRTDLTNTIISSIKPLSNSFYPPVTILIVLYCLVERMRWNTELKYRSASLTSPLQNTRTSTNLLSGHLLQIHRCVRIVFSSIKSASTIIDQTRTKGRPAPTFSGTIYINTTSGTIQTWQCLVYPALTRKLLLQKCTRWYCPKSIGYRVYERYHLVEPGRIQGNHRPAVNRQANV